MTDPKEPTDSEWPEVLYINSYCLFMGYLSMAVRGMGFLVVAWTTVVLLGGFVSMLGTEDFWSLTMIALVQTAGVFDVFLNEKLSHILDSLPGLAVTIGAMVVGEITEDDKPSRPRALIATVVLLVQLLVVAVILCPLAALYMWGLFISTGISLWRLIEHDYGGNADAANLKPALIVLYSLALFQGVLFCYRSASSLARWRLASDVAEDYKFGVGDPGRASVEDYLRETVIGCEKNPSFARRRNLVTYGVGLMKSDESSASSFLSGARILGKLLEQPELPEQHMLIWQLLGSASSSHVLQKLLHALDSRRPHDKDIRELAARIVAHLAREKDPSFAEGRNLVTYAVGLMKSDESSTSSFLSGARILDKLLELPELSGQHMLIRQLIGSASSIQVLQKLLQALDSRRPYDKDIRELAARIVAHLADEIRLKQFPRGIRCVSSLLEITSQQQDDDSAPSAHYKELVVQGLLILEKLAADEHDCRDIIKAQGLLSKAMAPVSSDLLHRIGHKEWSSIVAASLKLMCRLVTAPGETGTKLRRQILNKEVINSMESILMCENCDEQLYILAIKFKILTQLREDASSSMSTASREKFTTLLVGIFTDNNKDSSIRKLAGEALAMLSDATIILKANDTVVHDLSKMLLDVESSAYRIIAAEILEHLYIRYTQDDDYLKKLKEAMKDVMPKVLREILPCGSTGKGKQTEKTEKQANEDKFSAPNTDIEGQDGGVSQDNDRNNNNTSSCQQNDDVDEQHGDRKLQAALLSLSAAIFDKLISEDEDLSQLVDTIAPGDSAFSFAGKLREMVERNSEPTANCLRIMKITSRMVISMIKHNGSYVKADLESLVQSLSDASKNMLGLEGFMIFSSSDHDALKPVSILASLVKEAQELLDRKKQRDS